MSEASTESVDRSSVLAYTIEMEEAYPDFSRDARLDIREAGVAIGECASMLEALAGSFVRPVARVQRIGIFLRFDAAAESMRSRELAFEQFNVSRHFAPSNPPVMRYRPIENCACVDCMAAAVRRAIRYIKRALQELTSHHILTLGLGDGEERLFLALQMSDLMDLVDEWTAFYEEVRDVQAHVSRAITALDEAAANGLHNDQ